MQKAQNVLRSESRNSVNQAKDFIQKSPWVDEKINVIKARIEALNKKNLDLHRNSDLRLSLVKTLVEELSEGTTSTFKALQSKTLKN